jgi:lycopene cyclase domain-containing protein
MKEIYLYLALDLFTLSVPLIRAFESRIAYYKSFPSLFKAIFITACLFVPWDILFTAKEYWGFNPRYHLDFHLIGLPIEEWLFFVVVPFSCVFIYRVLNYFFPKEPPAFFSNALPKFLVWFPLGVAALNFGRWYTFSTFLLLGIAMGLCTYVWKVEWMGKFLRAFLVILLPFLIVNGVLTGSWIEEEVVWYNDFMTLGRRIGTIPMEDSFYGMLLILMNVGLYEFFESRRKRLLNQI